MYAVEIESSREAEVGLELVWVNPSAESLGDDAPVLLLECRSRRQAMNVLGLLEEGFVRESRRGDRLVFCVYRGREPVRLSLVRGMKTAA